MISHQKLNSQITSISFSILVFVFLTNSISIHYKSEIVDDHIEFLNAQIPRLKSENVASFIHLKKMKGYKKSAEENIDKFIPFIEYLFEIQNNYSFYDLETIDNYLVEQLEAPQLLRHSAYKNLSKNNQDKIIEYLYVQFQNELIKTVFLKYGTHSDLIIENQFSLVDMWTNNNYEIHLNYNPVDVYETDMKINGQLRNENALLFEPTRTGPHTFDISFSQFDGKGVEKKLNFTKEIMVLP